ncbi:CDP-alcohol phosphatidyltransferase family protein [Hwanghaeella grinnelliae]|nr:CDP-alcohol phosphatidyltransferase family protein [Hwanghaeella grinnelliae]
MIRKDDRQSGNTLDMAHLPALGGKAWPALHFLWAAMLLTGGLLLMPRLFAFTDLYITYSLSAFIVLVAAIGFGLYRFRDRSALKSGGFGAANAITMGRGVLICLVAGAIGQAWSASAAWTFVAVSSFALIMDGFDGWYARRNGDDSPFGALFDQETDAAFILILAILVVDQGKAGPWIVLSGLLRYLFVFTGLFVDRLRAPLGPSIRRKTVCVIQVVSLVVCLAPIIPPGLSLWIAALSLALLFYSFAVDVISLMKRQHA